MTFFTIDSFRFGAAAGTTLTDGLLAYYKLDGNSDDAVAANDGTDNSITYNTTNGIILSGAGLSSGSGSDITFNDNWIPSMDDMSVSCWVYFPTTTYGTGSPNVIGNGVSGGAGKYFSVDVASASKVLEFAVDSGGLGGVGRQTVNSGTFSTGTWYHVVGVRDTANAELRIYRNYNASTATTTGAGTATLTCTAVNSWIGQAVGGNQLNGRVDECAVWDRVLTEAEISELYNSGVGNQYPFE